MILYHLVSLSSAFHIRCLDSITKLTNSKVSRLLSANNRRQVSSWRKHIYNLRTKEYEVFFYHKIGRSLSYSYYELCSLNRRGGGGDILLLYIYIYIFFIYLFIYLFFFFFFWGGGPSCCGNWVVYSFHFCNGMKYIPVLILKRQRHTFSQTNKFFKSINSL